MLNKIENWKNDRNNFTAERWKTGNIMLNKLNGWIQNHLTLACRWWRGRCVVKFVTLLKFKLSFSKVRENIANNSWMGIQDAVSIWSKTVVISAKIYLKQFFGKLKKKKQTNKTDNVRTSWLPRKTFALLGDTFLNIN